MHSKKDHYSINDREFALRFVSLSLDPSWFTHEAHLRLGWIYVTRFGFEKGASQLCDHIQAFDGKFGDGKKYNKTVTFAFAYLIHQRQLLCSADNFSSFILQNQDLLTNYKDLLAEHYSMDLFSSDIPTDTMIQPDLKPFN